jgi:hypothetical protein
MKVEYTLDQWEWQGVTHSVEIDPEDYEGMSEAEINEAVYAEIHDDAVSNLHLVYAESEVAQEILESNAKD